MQSGWPARFAVPRPGPGEDLVVEDQGRAAVVPDHGAVGEVGQRLNGGALPSGSWLDALAVELRVHRRGAGAFAEGAGPGPGAGVVEEIPAPAVMTWAMAGGEGDGFVEEEQGGPASGRHRIAPDPLPVKDAADPRLRPPAGRAQAAVGAVQAAAVAHQQTAAGVGDDLLSGQNPVLQRHTGIMSDSTDSFWQFLAESRQCRQL